MMYKIVLTGGPAGGKSVALAMIRDSYGDRVETVPEAARIILENGFPVFGVDVEWSQDLQRSLQDAILPLQRSLEDAYTAKARAAGKKILVCDRGLLDGAAYTPGGRAVYLRRHRLKIQTVFARYEAVWHLASTISKFEAVFAEAKRDRIRFESRAETIQLEKRAFKVWEGHPNHKIIPATPTIDMKLAQVRSLLEEVIAHSSHGPR